MFVLADVVFQCRQDLYCGINTHWEKKSNPKISLNQNHIYYYFFKAMLF